MATVNLTEANFKDTVEKGIVLIDFWAAWCGPCQRFGPIFEEASGRHPDVVFGKVDTEAEQGLAGAFQIFSIPTLVAMRDGIVLGSQAGLLPGEALDDVIKQVKALDMDEIRRSIEAEKQADGEGADTGVEIV
ncbi:MAG TPA: thioredoxin domain-containing protein [Vicinamibacterales bacterium]|nr:thioredoxin domain-containing protein [Vicinamibacterales bacterium]